MTTARTRPHLRVPSAWAAGVALGVSMLGGAVLAAPHASAGCNLTQADDQYIDLLAQNGMTHSASFNDCHMAAEGQWFANQVRNSGDPLGTAKNLVSMVTETTGMKTDKAEWEVESAIYVYAPQMIPKLKDQLGPAPNAS